MNAFTFLMDTDNPHRYEHPSKKRGCKRARASRPRPHPQRSLLAYIRPPDWMSEPLDLGTDVITMIVEVLMRSEDYHKVRAIKALALVNRLCAAAVASTLDQVRAQLQHNGRECALAEKAKVLRLRAETTRSEQTKALIAEARRLHKVHEDYMEEVDIPQARLMGLAPFPDRTWFHDNRSLLGHLGNACELCNSTMQYRYGRGYQFIDGPVMLIACDVCKHKGCVELDLSYADATGQVLKVRIEQEETVANNYARALLSKHATRLKRMRSKRATRVLPAKLGKRVHHVGVSDELSLCYWNSDHRMAHGPWYLELWHTLPKGLPQGVTFGALMGVRNSDEVRKEAQEYAVLLRARRKDAAQKRSALSKLLRTYMGQRDAVHDVVLAGTFEGWVQAIELCSTARAFEVRWLFRWDEDHVSRVPPSWRANQYKLLTESDLPEFGAAVRRVATVARVLAKGFKRTTIRYDNWPTDGSSERACMLALMRNFTPAFLERGPVVVDQIVDLVRCAAIELKCPANSSEHSQTLLVTYTLVGEPFDGRRMEIVSYFSDHIVQRICKKFDFQPQGKETLTQVMVRGLASYVNRPLVTDAYDHSRILRNNARAEIFALPAVWPTWLLA